MRGEGAGVVDKLMFCSSEKGKLLHVWGKNVVGSCPCVEKASYLPVASLSYTQLCYLCLIYKHYIGDTS